MGIKDIIERLKQKSAKFKEMEEDYRLKKKLEQKQKSSNERELERFYEEEKQQKIKDQLAKFRKKRQGEGMKTTILQGKNIFKEDGHNILKSDKLNMKTNLKGNMFFK